MTKVNLNGVEAWKGGGILPQGTHHVEITSAEEKTKNDKPQVEVELRAVGGEFDGGTIRDWIFLVPQAMGRVRQFLEAVKYEIPDGDFEMPTNQLVGRQVQIIVRDELYEGETRSKVKAYEATGTDVPVPAGAGATKDEPDLPF